MGEAALQAGNSEAIIRKHYLDLKTAAEAEEFFGIMPKRMNGLPAGDAAPASGANAPLLEFQGRRTRAA